LAKQQHTILYATQKSIRKYLDFLFQTQPFKKSHLPHTNSSPVQTFIALHHPIIMASESMEYIGIITFFKNMFGLYSRL